MTALHKCKKTTSAIYAELNLTVRIPYCAILVSHVSASLHEGTIRVPAAAPFRPPRPRASLCPWCPGGLRAPLGRSRTLIGKLCGSSSIPSCLLRFFEVGLSILFSKKYREILVEKNFRDWRRYFFYMLRENASRFVKCNLQKKIGLIFISTRKVFLTTKKTRCQNFVWKKKC